MSCSVDGCRGITLARGWCSKHYNRWRKHGDPVALSRYPSSEQRFWNSMENGDNGCWLWTASTDKSGYGLLRVAGKTKLAHRYAYELMVDAIPDGLQIDHICRERKCVNPQHLRLATAKQNAENRSRECLTSMSGVRGVYPHRESGKWMAQVGHAGKRHYLGLFESVSAASEAVAAERNRLHTHNACDRVNGL